MANEDRIVVTVNNGAPAYFTAVTSPTGGSWSAKTISLRMVAFRTSAETDIDLAGLDRAAVAGWDNISVALNDKLEFTFTKPDDAQRVDHYAFYYQEAATFDPSAAAYKCTAVVTHDSIAVCSVVVADDDDTASLTFGAAAASVTLNPCPVSATARERAASGFDGSAIQRSWAVDTIFSALELKLDGTSCSAADFSNLQDWARYTATLRLEDGDTSSKIRYFDGVFTAPAAFLNSSLKDSRLPGLTFHVEAEVLR